MLTKDDIVIYKDTGERVRIVEKLSNGYYKIRKGEHYKENRIPIHESRLEKYKFKSYVENISYADSGVFSDKATVMQIYLYVLFNLGKEFLGSDVIGDSYFVQTGNGEAIEFCVQYCEYNADFFRWTKDTFKRKNVYILQKGDRYNRIFNAGVVRERLVSDISIVDGKMVFNQNGIFGVIHSNFEKTKFGCDYGGVADLVSTNIIDKQQDV